MTDLKDIFGKLGFTDKETAVYQALLALGPSAIRKIADKAGINRGTTHEALKTLQKEGLVSYYHKEKHQHFVAESPKTLQNIFLRRKNEFDEIEEDIEKMIPALESVSPISNRPVVKFYEGYAGVRSILEDVLDSVEDHKLNDYVVYSSSTIRPYLYHKKAFPDFTEERIRRKISVRTIASGAGGSTQGRDDRKWLSKQDGAPTYRLIYAGKVAMISASSGLPHGIIVEDSGIYKTEVAIFNELWKSL
jgi:sugar-specific transcriptional regulator TrmB